MAIDYSKIPSPCFVLEEQALINNLSTLQYVEKASGGYVLCALKGFAMHATFPLVKEYVSGATASSLNEARLCYEEMGVKAHLCAPVYLAEEFDEILKYSSHITFNSIAQWERFGQKALAGGLVCAIRVNPQHSTVDTALYDPSDPGSRLGVDPKYLKDGLPEGVTGIHFHTLCENNSYELKATLSALEHNFSKALEQAKWLNMGGGHHVTRKDYDVALLIELIKVLKQKYNIEVFLEPGEAFGLKTGALVSTVRDVVENGGIHTAMLDVSFSAHMPDCLEMPYKPVVIGAREPVEGELAYRLGGATCLAGDYMGDYTFDKQLSVGDRVIFDDMIHYTMVKTTTFNGVGLPSIGIWTKDDQFKLVKAFGYEDYKSRLS